MTQENEEKLLSTLSEIAHYLGEIADHTNAILLNIRDI